MSDSILIQKIIDDITTAHKNGTTQFSSDNMLNYLDLIKNTATESNELQERSHQIALKQLESTSQSNLAMFNSVIESGKEALRAALIACGGAVVAILALLGNLDLEIMKRVAHSISLTLCIFSVSTLCVLLAYACRYLSQLYYSDEKSEKYGIIYHYSAIFLCLGSYFLFVWGIISTHQAFLHNF